MTSCIYCPQEANSEEHHLPLALGKFKGYVALKDRLCSSCNSKCGKLDEQLSRSGIEAWHRKRLGIGGRKAHKKVNPFYRGSAGGKAIEMTAAHPVTGKVVPLELLGGNEVRELRCVTLTAEDGTDYVIRIFDGMTSEQFKKCINRLPVNKFKTADISASEQEAAWVESIIKKGLKFESRTDWEPSKFGRTFYGPVTVKVRGDARYFRCIAKIGFHYFLTKMSQFRGDEDCFAAIRGFIISDSTTLADCTRFLTVSRNSLRSEQRREQWGHILSAGKNDLHLGAGVRLFVGPDSTSRTYDVDLGRNPSLIHCNQSIADFFGYYPRSGTSQFDGEASEFF